MAVADPHFPRLLPAFLLYLADPAYQLQLRPLGDSAFLIAHTLERRR